MESAPAVYVDRALKIFGGKRRMFALGTPDELKQRIPHASRGHAPTLEEVFLELTGKQLVMEEAEA
jgi:hypothetical protein